MYRGMSLNVATTTGGTALVTMSKKRTSILKRNGVEIRLNSDEKKEKLLTVGTNALKSRAVTLKKIHFAVLYYSYFITTYFFFQTSNQTYSH